MLLSPNGNIEKNNNDWLLSQNVQVENLLIGNEGQLILNNTKTEISNISSKGEISPLVKLFEENICTLRKTTLAKFNDYLNKYESDFIKSIILYGVETNAKSFSWFETTIKSYISKNMTTSEEVELHIKEYRKKNKQAKIRALKQKEEKRKRSEESHKRDIAGYDVLDNMEYDCIPSYDTTNGEIANNLKDLLKDEISEVQYNTWIKPYDFIKIDEKIIIECPNKFTVDTIEKNYYNKILRELRKNNIQERLVLSIKN